MSKKCPQCGKQRFTPFAMGSTVYMDAYKCNVCGAECTITQLEDITLFDRITQSPEVLAEKLVYRVAFKSDKGVHIVYRSTLYANGEFWYSKEEALAATVARLKEVEK